MGLPPPVGPQVLLERARGTESGLTAESVVEQKEWAVTQQVVSDPPPRVML